MNQRRVAIIGGGYVGLVTGAGLAKLGHEVTIIENNPDWLEALRSGPLPVQEEGLDEVVDEVVLAGDMDYQSALRLATHDPEIVIIAVGTPMGEGGRHNLDALWKVVEDIRALSVGRIVVIKSTVPPGTCEKVQMALAADHVVSHPEFLAEGTAVHDFFNPDRLVVGVGPEGEDAGLEVLALYDKLGEDDLVVPQYIVSWEEAEMAKSASNAHLACRIALTNEIGRICGEVGADVSNVMGVVGADRRIGPYFLRAGIGFGGSCFRKDVESLSRHLPPTPILQAINPSNDDAMSWPLTRLWREWPPGERDDKVVAVWGLAFKPGTNDTRDSPAVGLIDQMTGLSQMFFRVHDPLARWSWDDESGRVVQLSSVSETVLGADALIVCTEWTDYAAPDWKEVKRLMRGDLVIDGRLMYEPEDIVAACLRYAAPGRTAL